MSQLKDPNDEWVAIKDAEISEDSNATQDTEGNIAMTKQSHYISVSFSLPGFPTKAINLTILEMDFSPELVTFVLNEVKVPGNHITHLFRFKSFWGVFPLSISKENCMKF